MGTRILNPVLWFAVFLVLSWQNFTAQYQATICSCVSSQRRVSTWGWSRVAVSWCGKVVTRCLARAGRTGDGALRAVAQSASSLHYVEHNKASLIFKLVRHKCFLLPYFHRLCGGSPHLSHCDSSWEALGRRRPLYFSFPRDPLCPETPERAINKRTDGWWLCLW